MQTVSCEIKFAHAHVRSHLHVCDVRAKRIFKRACGTFRACDVQSHFSTLFVEKMAIAINGPKLLYYCHFEDFSSWLMFIHTFLMLS